MVGNPGETVAMALETYVLNRRISPDFAWCSLLNPYPGTAIHKICVDMKCLDKSPEYSLYGHSYFTDSPLNIPDKKEIINLQKILYVSLLLKLPVRVVRFLIRLPLTPLYRLLFGAGMVLGLSRINKGALIPALKLSLLHFIRYNRSGKRGLT
jgi:hypothetical protein